MHFFGVVGSKEMVGNRIWTARNWIWNWEWVESKLKETHTLFSHLLPIAVNQTLKKKFKIFWNCF